MYRARSWMPCLAALVISALPAGCTSPASRVAVDRQRPRANALQQQLLMVARSYEMQGETFRARQLYSEILAKNPRYTEAREQLARLDATIVNDPEQRAARQHAIAQAFEREGRPEIAQRFYANLNGHDAANSQAVLPGEAPPQLPIAATPEPAKNAVSVAKELPLPALPKVDKPVARQNWLPFSTADQDPRGQKTARSIGERKLTPPSNARTAKTDRKPAAGPLNRIKQSAAPRFAMLSRWLTGRKNDSRKAKPTTAGPAKNKTRETPGSATLAAAKPEWHHPKLQTTESPQDADVPTPLPLPELKPRTESTVAAIEDNLSPADETEPVENQAPALPTIEPKALVMKLDAAPVTAPEMDSEPEVADVDFSVDSGDAAQELPEPLAGLVARLHHEDAQERTLAAYLLGKSGQSAAAALPALRSQFENESEMRVKIHLAEAIAKVDPADEGGMDALLGLLSDESDRTRWLAVIALGDVLSGADENANANPQRSEKIAAGLVESLKDDAPRVRSMAALALAHLKDAANPAVPELKKLLDDENAEVREAADAALACIQVSHTEE